MSNAGIAYPHHKALLPLLIALLGAPLVAACGDDTETGGSGGAGGNPSTGGSGGTADGGAAEGGAGGVGGGEGGVATTGPIDAPADQWTFVEFPGATCMDGSPTGIGINPHATSDDVVIFLMGGNACFNFASCLIVANPDGYGSEKFDNDVADFLSASPYFDRQNPDNPFRDYSYVFVPYCTGDVHAGDKADVVINDKTYQFHGFSNMRQYLERIVPTFTDASSVVLTGVSAGGFGAAYNYDQVASAFGNDVNVTLIDDSGPPMAEEFVPQCLQQHFVDTWGIENTLPEDCAECGVNGIFLEPFINYVFDKYPDRSLGLVSSEGDATIRQFWGFGENDCASINGAPAAYPEDKYLAGLEDLRDRIGADGRFKMFLVPGTEHVFVDNGLDAVTVNGVALEDWIVQGIEGDPNWANVSEP
ncbi:MAG: hypothetical protein HOW73_11735 [Polyangiaceae bacterium]|nr:hypothetical protein [Polyangiaceae bacterium]